MNRLSWLVLVSACALSLSAGAATTSQSQPDDEDLGTVRAKARDQAQMMARRVVNIYGSAERALNSYHRGFWDGLDSFVAGRLDRSADYRLSKNKGSDEGSLAGDRSGEDEAKSLGEASGHKVAADRFTTVVDRNISPDLSVPNPQIPQVNLTPSLKIPKKVEDRVGDYADRFYSELNSFNYSDDDFQFIRPFDYSVINLADLFRTGHGELGFHLFRNRYGRSSWAWSAWTRREIGGSYSSSLEYYKTISDCKITANCSVASSTFETTFKSEFEDQIAIEWRSTERRPDRKAYDAGQNLGADIGQGYVRDQGYYDGYTDGFADAGKRAFNRSYTTSFQQGFKSTVDYYQTHAVISQVDVSAEPVAWPYLPGTAVTIVVKKVSNAGRVGGDVEISVFGDHLKSVKKATITVKPGASTMGPITYTWLGQVTYDVPPNKPYYFTVRAGEASQTFSYQVYWWDVASSLGRVSGDPQKWLADYMALHLGKEWAAGPDLHRGYKEQVSLLENIVKVYNSGDLSVKAGLAKYRETLRAAYGVDRPSWWSGKRDDWDVATALLDQLK